MLLTLQVRPPELLQTRHTYLQPASLILRAYIFPMSPMPMMPTVLSKSAMVASECASQR